MFNPVRGKHRSGCRFFELRRACFRSGRSLHEPRWAVANQISLLTSANTSDSGRPRTSLNRMNQSVRLAVRCEASTTVVGLQTRLLDVHHMVPLDPSGISIENDEIAGGSDRSPIDVSGALKVRAPVGHRSVTQERIRQPTSKHGNDETLYGISGSAPRRHG